MTIAPSPAVASHIADRARGGRAMALFLLRDTGRYRGAMDRYMADVAAGSVYRPADFSRLKMNEWNPALSQPQLEHYLGVPLVKIEAEYREYCKQLASRAGEE